MGHDADSLARLEAMRLQEEAGPSSHNYLQRRGTSGGDDAVDEACRSSMIGWLRRLQTPLKLHPETIGAAIAFLDRYLSSGRGSSSYALDDRYGFQLAAITSLYIAIKLREHMGLDAKALSKMTHNYYAPSDILTMETDLLFALEWRVSSPKPMDFTREYLHLLSPSIDASTSATLLASSQKHAEEALGSIDLAFRPPSVVGAACLAASMIEHRTLTPETRRAVWREAARTSEDVIGIMEAQLRLLGGSGRIPSILHEKKAMVEEQDKNETRSIKLASSFNSCGKSPVCASASLRGMHRLNACV